MYKKAFLLILIINISLSSFAQIKFGVKGGANVVKISGQAFSGEYKYGFHAGGFAEIGLSPQFAIQPEILFNQVTSDTASNVDEVYQNLFKKNIKLSYLSIPLLLNYKPGKILTVQAGPQFGILIDKNKTGIENGKSAFKSGDLSLLGGLQLNLSNFRVYGRYALGLSNLNDIDDKDKWTSQSFQVGVGMSF
jgi:hypothetical protein